MVSILNWTFFLTKQFDHIQSQGKDELLKGAFEISERLTFVT